MLYFVSLLDPRDPRSGGRRPLLHLVSGYFVAHSYPPLFQAIADY